MLGGERKKLNLNHGFIVIPTPHYNDEVFELLSKNKYKYGVNYVIYPENVF